MVPHFNSYWDIPVEPPDVQIQLDLPQEELHLAATMLTTEPAGSETKPRLSQRRKVILIALVALGVRLAGFASALERDGFFSMDYAIHTEIGRNAMNGDYSRTTDAGYLEVYEKIQAQRKGLITVSAIAKPPENELEPVFYIDPGYGIQAGLLWKLLGTIDWKPVIVLQLIIDAAMVFLLFGIGMALGKPRPGLWVAGLHAVFPLEIQQALVPHYDVFISYYYISLVYLLLKDQEISRPWGSIAIMASIGLLSAYVSWIRSTGAFMPFFVVLYLLAMKRSRLQFLKAAVLLAVFATAFAIPKTSYNYRHFDRFDMVRGCKWWNVYTGLGQFSNPFGLIGTDGDVVRYVTKVDPQIRIGPPGVLDYRHADELIKPYCLRLISENPGWYVTTCLKRAALVAFPGFYFHARFLAKSTSEGQWFSSFLPILSLFWSGVIVALGLWSLLFLFGAYHGLRESFWAHLVVLLPFLYSAVSIAPMFLQHRSITNIFFVQFFFGILALQQLKASMPWRRVRLLGQIPSRLLS